MLYFNKALNRNHNAWKSTTNVTPAMQKHAREQSIQAYKKIHFLETSSALLHLKHKKISAMFKGTEHYIVDIISVLHKFSKNLSLEVTATFFCFAKATNIQIYLESC